MIYKMKRSVTFIPLLPTNEQYQKKAIEFVDQHLQFSLSVAKEMQSEVIRCMIATDIYAKDRYYEKRDTMYFDFERPESKKGISQKLFELQMKLFEEKSSDMNI